MLSARKHVRVLWLLLIIPAALALLAMPGAAVHAQSGGGIDLDWWTVDGGGLASEGGGLTLTGTAGQPDAGPVLSGGGLTLAGGYWPVAAPVRYGVYLPIVLRATE